MAFYLDAWGSNICKTRFKIKVLLYSFRRRNKHDFWIQSGLKLIAFIDYYVCENVPFKIVIFSLLYIVLLCSSCCVLLLNTESLLYLNYYYLIPLSICHALKNHICIIFNSNYTVFIKWLYCIYKRKNHFKKEEKVHIFYYLRFNFFRLTLMICNNYIFMHRLYHLVLRFQLISFYSLRNLFILYLIKTGVMLISLNIIAVVWQRYIPNCICYKRGTFYITQVTDNGKTKLFCAYYKSQKGDQHSMKCLKKNTYFLLLLIFYYLNTSTTLVVFVCKYG